MNNTGSSRSVRPRNLRHLSSTCTSYVTSPPSRDLTIRDIAGYPRGKARRTTEARDRSSLTGGSVTLALEVVESGRATTGTIDEEGDENGEEKERSEDWGDDPGKVRVRRPM